MPSPEANRVLSSILGGETPTDSQCCDVFDFLYISRMDQAANHWDVFRVGPGSPVKDRCAVQ